MSEHVTGKRDRERWAGAALVLCDKCAEERLRVPQVGGVEALGEPAVDRRQERAG
jgi:hypothetical protein